jgi:hypothetical protein
MKAPAPEDWIFLAGTTAFVGGCGAMAGWQGVIASCGVVMVVVALLIVAARKDA